MMQLLTNIAHLAPKRTATLLCLDESYAQYIPINVHMECDFIVLFRGNKIVSKSFRY